MTKTLNFHTTRPGSGTMRRNPTGFTLIELAVVLVIVGIVISIVATVLPSLIQAAKIKKAQAILEKMDYAVQGYALANHRLPCADGDGDGQEDSGTFLGTLPFLSLGLSSNHDAWGNAVRYGVYDTLTAAFADGNAFCTAIAAASVTPFASTKAFTTSADHLSGATTSNSANQAYVLATGGAKDLDSANGFFDLGNGEGTATAPGFNFPGKIQSPTYDDLVRAFSLNELNQKNCNGGGGSGGGGGSTGVENTNALCSDGIDNDGDGYIDCFDQDCCGAGLTACSQCPPQANVQINTGPMAGGTVGGSYTHTFQAIGGSGYYYWYLDGITPNIPGLTISLWNGTLSGTIDNCAGDYSVNVHVEDRYDSAKTDSHTFTLTVSSSTVTVTPSPGGGGPTSPDFMVNNSVFSQVFTASGDHVGDFHWSINWQGTNPGGFQIDDHSATEGRLWKSGSSTAGNFVFTLTAVDASCASNTITTNPYSMTITPSGAVAPYTEGMEGEWRFDECAIWDGSGYDVVDSKGNLNHYGRASGGAVSVSMGKMCRAASFDGVDDKIVSQVLTGSDIMVFTGQMSLACWFKSPGGGGTFPRLIEFSDASGSSSSSAALAYDPDGSLRAWVTDQASGVRAGVIDYSATLYNDNQWHHAVYTYSSANGGRLYVDGSLKQTATNNPTANIADAETFVIGGYFPDTNNGFHGLIDEVMVFSRELTQEDVTNLYTLSRDSCSGSCYPGPVAEYRMENFPWSGAAGEVVDSGSGGTNGVAAVAGSGSIPIQTTPSSGKVCRAGIFARVDGNNGGYLDLGDPADGDLDPGTSPWTVSAWFKWDGSAGENILINKENLYEVRLNGGYLEYAWQPHWAWDGGTSFPVTADTWTYMTVLYDGSQQVLYKNGRQVYVRNQTGAIGANTSKLLIGARGSGSPLNFFGGEIDEVRVYNRALAKNEIQADMDETRDCSADSVVITTTSLSQGTINSVYDTTLSATGGTPPYGWEIIAPNPIAGLSIVPNTGELQGTTNVCAGDYPLTIRVTDAGSRMDERTFTLTVANGTLAVTPASPQTFACNSSTFSQNFIVTGPRLGPMGNWQIQWLGTNPGGFEVVGTGDTTARFRKINTSTPGSGYQFKLTANDTGCAGNQVDSGFYTLDISGGGADAPYYAGMIGEWHMDECSWDGSAGEVQDTSGSGAHGSSINLTAADTPDRSVGHDCYSAVVNLGTTTSQYVSLGNAPFTNLGDFSLALWFRVDSLSSTMSTIFSGARSGATNNLLLYLNGSGNTFLTWINNVQTGSFSMGTSVAVGLWHHVVWTRDVSDGSETVYLDGSGLSDTNGSANTSNVSLDPGGVILGQEQDSVGGGFDANQVFHGWIDEVLLYDKVLTPAEAATLSSLSHSCSGSCYTSAAAQYRMDENSWVIDQAGDVTDSSGNGRDGTPRGTAAIDQADSHLCYSGSFSNNNSFAEITGLPVSTSAGDKTTACFWMKWNGNGSEMPIGWGSSYDLYFRNGNEFGFNTGASDLYGISGAAALAGSWHHVAAIFTNNAPLRNQLYIDGALQPIAVITGTPQNRTVNTNFYISGWDSGTNNYKYDGHLDEVRVYARGLSAGEVIQDMNTSHSCPGGP
jgi:prepilin-type N-terminal cleavage/methylation domain-containing protein